MQSTLAYRIVNRTAHYNMRARSVFVRTYPTSAAAFAAAAAARVNNPTIEEYVNGRLMRTMYS